MRKIFLFSLLVFVLTVSVWAEDESQDRNVDKIIIDGTWMTRDVIVLGKLGFGEGDSVSPEDLEEAEKALYGLGLFSKVEFSWVEEEDGTTTLHVLAKDQLHIMPLVAWDGSSSVLKLGAADGNFLGFNVDLSLAYEQEKEYAQYDFIKRRIRGSFGLPDSLLNGFKLNQVVDFGFDGNKEHEIKTDFSLPTRWFNNGSLSFSFSKSLNIRYDAENGIKESGYSDNRWNVGTSFSYPWVDSFSQSVRLGWFSTEIGDEGLQDVSFGGDLPMGQQSYLYWGTGLSYGEILTKNSYFQKNGWKVFANYGMDIKTAGDDSYESLIHDFSIGAEGHWLAFNWLEIAGYADYGIGNRNKSIRVHSTRDRSVAGLSISGTNYYALTAQAHITYVNIDWFALEHVTWFDVAKGENSFSDLFSSAPAMAVGTGLRLRIPNIPWLYFYIDIQWALPATGQDFWGFKI